MRGIAAFWGVGLVFLGGLATAAAAEDQWRIPFTYPFDATTTETALWEATISYQSLPDTDVSPEGTELLLTTTGAFAPAARFEIGGALGYSSRDYENEHLGSPSGLTDAQVWGKYRFAEIGSAVWTAGLTAALPTGSEDDFLGTGNLDPGAFLAAGVKTQGGAFVQAHLGMRMNKDFSNNLFKLDGKTSTLLGFGGVFRAENQLEGFASLTLETERYDGGDSLGLLAAGARFPLGNNFKVQVQAGAGIGSASPDLSLGVGIVFAP